MEKHAVRWWSSRGLIWLHNLQALLTPNNVIEKIIHVFIKHSTITSNKIWKPNLMINTFSSSLIRGVFAKVKFPVRDMDNLCDILFGVLLYLWMLRSLCFRHNVIDLADHVAVSWSFSIEAYRDNVMLKLTYLFFVRNKTNSKLQRVKKTFAHWYY